MSQTIGPLKCLLCGGTSTCTQPAPFPATEAGPVGHHRSNSAFLLTEDMPELVSTSQDSVKLAPKQGAHAHGSLLSVDSKSKRLWSRQRLSLQHTVLRGVHREKAANSRPWRTAYPSRTPPMLFGSRTGRLCWVERVLRELWVQNFLSTKERLSPKPSSPLQNSNPSVFWAEVVGQDKPMLGCKLSCQGLNISLAGMMDRGADVTAISSNDWPSHWELQLAEDPSPPRRCTSVCLLGTFHQPKGSHAALPVASSAARHEKLTHHLPVINMSQTIGPLKCLLCGGTSTCTQPAPFPATEAGPVGHHRSNSAFLLTEDMPELVSTSQDSIIQATLSYCHKTFSLLTKVCKKL
ncbi:uncharacterized protein [Aphelocoma coerulescens]|uniref:uncharacterized protein n=1 Tax=Aphelocoma coerulescens TaxID=39617 RepID=UPI00360457C4